MYQVLYRKWRPKTFEDVVGQQHITDTLKNEIASGRIAHAYLFTGSRGIGKTTCAKILAKAVNCKNPEKGNPCLECEFCRDIEAEKMMDITEIDAASNNGVENIRSMRDEAYFSPSVCKYRVYIVDEVHMLSIGAFNAFLKILEEPPEHIIFILATTEIHKLPATIISRCQRFDFYRPSVEQISERIKFVCEKEQIKIEDEAAEILAKVSDGGVRDALSILDRCINREDGTVKFENVKEIIGITGNEHIFKFANGLCNKDISDCLEVIENIHQKSKNMIKFCEEVMEYFRNLMIFKSTGIGEEELRINAEKLNLSEVFNILDILKNSYKDMAFGNNKKLEMEIAVIKICENKNAEISENKINLNPEFEKKLSELFSKIQEFEQKLKELSSQKNITKSEQKQPEISITKKSSNEVPESKNAIKMENWGEILDHFRKTAKSKSICTALKGSEAYISENFVLINAKTSLAFELLRESANRESMKTAIQEITGIRYNLGPYIPTEGEKISTKKEKIQDDCVTSIKNELKQEEDPTESFLKSIGDDVEIIIN